MPRAMAQVSRVLDANANRAREAMRVLEDAARFLLNDADLSAALKAVRHDLASALGALGNIGAIELSRDTPGDVGTSIRTAREQARASTFEVVVAAGKRLTEALRCLEEYGKIVSPRFGETVEALRYRSYDIEHRLHRSFGATGRRRPWRLCVLLSEDLCVRGDWGRVARAAIEGGADCIQVREKGLGDGALFHRACGVLDLCRPRGVAVVVNDRPDVALAAGADGVHLGQDDLPCARVRAMVGRQLLIGVSTSNLREAREALGAGADYCGVGPMFATPTKHKDAISGPAYLREYVQWARLPHLAIGGIALGNVGKVLDAGCRGIAVSSAVCGASDPASVVRQLANRMPKSEPGREE